MNICPGSSSPVKADRRIRPAERPAVRIPCTEASCSPVDLSLHVYSMCRLALIITRWWGEETATSRTNLRRVSIVKTPPSLLLYGRQGRGSQEEVDRIARLWSPFHHEGDTMMSSEYLSSLHYHLSKIARMWYIL